ncbi:MAG: chromate transporter [Bacillota bacterium]|jgi:chromate transporter
MTIEPTIPRLLLVFLRVGAFTFGGGYAMVPLIRQQLVRHGWLSEEEFTDLLGLAQGAPGPIAVNTAVYAGLALKGLAGAGMAVLGVILPSFLVILAIAMLMPGLREYPLVTSAFYGLRPAVVALIASAAFQVGRRVLRGWHNTLIGLLAFTGLYLNLHPALVVTAFGLWGLAAPVLGVKKQ